MKLNCWVLIALAASSSCLHAEMSIKPGRWLDTSKNIVNGIDIDAQSKKEFESFKAQLPADQRAEYDKAIAGQSGGGDDSQEYACVKPEDTAISAKDYMAKIMREMNDSSQSCTYSDQHADAKKISYKFVCSTNAQVGQSKGRVQMDFKETSYHIEVTGSVDGPTQAGKKGERQMISHTISDGKWVSAKCQPGDVRVTLGAGAHTGE